MTQFKSSQKSHTKQIKQKFINEGLPGTAGGTVLLRARMVALALSSLENFLGQLIPAVTMFGLSKVPSR